MISAGILSGLGGLDLAAGVGLAFAATSSGSSSGLSGLKNGVSGVTALDRDSGVTGCDLPSLVAGLDPTL